MRVKGVRACLRAVRMSVCVSVCVCVRLCDCQEKVCSMESDTEVGHRKPESGRARVQGVTRDTGRRKRGAGRDEQPETPTNQKRVGGGELKVRGQSTSCKNGVLQFIF